MEYATLADAMGAAVRSMPGFVDAKTFTAEDGERVTVVTFRDAEAMAHWRDHRGHRAAQARGRDELYTAYTIQSGPSERVIRWTRD